jgi:hypothetical protein
VEEWIVTGTWAHERHSEKTMSDFRNDFTVTFNKDGPPNMTLNWKRKLFQTGSIMVKPQSGKP